MECIDSREKIDELYKKLTQQEEENDKYLESIMARQVNLEAKLNNITKALPNLQILHNDAVKLADMISHTSTLAESVSAKVRQLDISRSRVSECQQRVQDLQDLKLCKEGVKTALENEEYEKAAGHIHRFLAMDQAALKKTASHMSQGRSVEDCFTQLDSATKELRLIVAKNFEQAAAKDNAADVERFFKIFPLLGDKAEGLKRFSTYLAGKLTVMAQKTLKTCVDTPIHDKRAPVVYADALTLLFEGIARVLEAHQPIVETFYGPGNLLDVIERLQQECDKESRKILTELIQRRNLDHIVRQVDDASRGGAPMHTVASSASLVSMTASASVGQTHRRAGSTGGSIESDRKVPDPRDLDPLLNELSIAHSRAELYMRFLRRRITTDFESGDEEQKEAGLKQMELVLQRSDLCRLMQELLGHYLLLERYYMSESVRKAMTLDTLDGEDSQTSSVLDDVFYILRMSIRRSSQSGSMDGTCAVINDACTLLEIDFCSYLHRQLKKGYSSGYLDLTAQAYNMWQSSLQQGRLNTSTQSDSDSARVMFLAHLNNADASLEFIKVMIRGLEEDIVTSIGAKNLTANDQAKLSSCLSGFGSVTASLRHVAEYGLQQLIASAVKPRTGPWVDAFMQANHQLTEEEFASYEADEPFVQNLIHNLEGLLSSFKAKLTFANYDALVGHVASEITTQMEKVIMKSCFNRLGGLALDKEVRGLAGYLTAATTLSIRDKLARLTQIATVLNLEKPSEMSDYWGSSAGHLWRLTASEVRQIMLLRVDFKAEEIKKLKL
ncbi:conserved oligomeric Golgi complex subunit 4 [Cloeon dipterum]|uniref:conserved oligomeric Golgi complex subunit 4 n=1 Tax=Cloeon dipterum TaxID=197152 RepID=UPI0032205C0A